MLQRFLPSSRRDFNSLSEQEILALAISSEEDDARIYLAYADGLREEYPASAKVFEEMAEEEDGHRKALIEPNCNGSLLRFDYKEGGKSKHVLLFANPHSQTGRDHHSIQVSFDEGRTWPEKYRLLLDEGRGNGYPSLSRIDDQHIGIVYEGSQAYLVFEKLSLDELLKR